MSRLLTSFLLITLSLCTKAQGLEPTAADHLYADTLAKPRYYFPEGLSITMADGKVKKVSELQAGEPIKCIKGGVVMTTCIQRIESTQNSNTWLTALYLRPVDERAASLDTWPLVPAMVLETTPTLSVTTQEGPKTISQLRKGDVLYRFEPSTQQVSAWKVGIVQRKARKANTLYSVVTDEGSFLLENMIALDR